MSDECIKIALDNINPKTSLLKFLSDQTFEKHAVPFEKQPVSFTKHAVRAAIGSERGWSERERRMLEEAGYVRLGMGKRILRTETASTVATSLILGAMGYLD
jgi:RsmE family RNA methyltransferase